MVGFPKSSHMSNISATKQLAYNINIPAYTLYGMYCLVLLTQVIYTFQLTEKKIMEGKIKESPQHSRKMVFKSSNFVNCTHVLCNF